MTTLGTQTLENCSHFTRQEKLSIVMQVLEMVEKFQAEKAALKRSLRNIMSTVGTIRGIEAFNMKNKFGFTKDEAKKIYYKYRKKEEPETPPPEKSPKPNPGGGESQSTDQKIAMIMDYMKDTTAKLEKIENDIDYLKQQVDRILKQI